ncbi:MAG TPA: hypothetical protein VGL57_03390 [Solirubrobacteraceae bacterium]|jgi:hypothetical protein
MSAEEYEVTIGMAAATAAALSAEGSRLCAMLAVEAADQATLPVLWLQTGQYSTKTTVRWPGACSAYTSPWQGPIKAGGTITPGFSAPMSAGQQLSVDQPIGTGEVTTPGPMADAIAVLNETTTPLATGIAQELNGAFPPICASPLYGKSVELFVPLEQILLAFSNIRARPGTVVTSLFAPGMLVDLTGVTARTVQFDINQGWSCGGATWGQAVGATDDVVPLLVRQSAELSRAARSMAATL